MYELLILVSTGTSASLQRLESAVRSEFASLTPPQAVATSLQQDRLTVTVGDFSFFVDFSCRPHVLQESAEIAQQFAASHPARAEIAAAPCRFELSSPEDPDMDHLNDMVFICQAAESLGRVHIFDPQAGEFQ